MARDNEMQVISVIRMIEAVEREVEIYDHGEIPQDLLIRRIRGQLERAYNRGICVGVSGNDKNCPD